MTEMRRSSSGRPRRSTGARGAEFAGLLEPGVYRLRVTAPGHATQEQIVHVSAGGSEEVEVVLGR